MMYPISPFSENIKALILQNRINSENTQNNKIQNETYLNNLLKWLCTYPKLTSFRVNTLTFNVDEIRTLLEIEVKQLAKSRVIPKIEVNLYVPDIITVHNCDVQDFDVNRKANEVIVDVNCAAAILRGANIFAPGIIGMLSGTKINDTVSIYSDLVGKCRKGFCTIYQCPNKLFIGNGIVKMCREHLFGANLIPVGIAVEVTDRISGCLSLNESLLPSGSILLQNIPSAMCIHTLKLKPGLTVLDMCAAPGNKTTHIAHLIQNKGTLIALDKTPSKVKKLRETCNKFSAKVYIFQADSTKILGQERDNINKCDVIQGPPFSNQTFDRILLDAPCSALGKRPQLSNNISEAVLKSYVPLQRKLLENAVHLLKVDGYLIYSTCTITLTENEAMVAWALKSFDCLQLVKPEPYLEGGQGLLGTDLTESQRVCLQRFGPDQEIDSVGFFYALFTKTK